MRSQTPARRITTADTAIKRPAKSFGYDLQDLPQEADFVEEAV
ncbi:MAG: hypothetical protein AB8B51_12425 [Sedimentitalea sp.]